MKQIISLFAFCLTMVCVACSHDGGPIGPPVDVPSRTVIAYIVATNNLDGADAANIVQMQRAVRLGALGSKGRLMIYRTTYDDVPRLCEMLPTGQLITVKEYADGVDSLDPEFMSAVVDDAVAATGTDEYGLVMWSHSTGWLGIDDIPDNAAQRSFGDDYGRKLSMPRLASAFARMPHFAFIYFDSCFMGNVESLYELRHAADWIVASPAEIPFDGAPYDISLASFYKPLPQGLAECAKNAYDYYISQTDPRNRSTTMSVFRMSAIDAVADAVHGVMSASSPAGNLSGVQQYGFEIRGANFPNMFFDCEDYLTGREATLCRQVSLTAALRDFVTVHYETQRMWNVFPLERVCGLSMFPYDELTMVGDRYYYTNLEWYKHVYSK